MARIPKSREWTVTWTWTGQRVQVFAPTRLLAKMNGSALVYGHAARYGEFTAGLVPAKKKES